MIKKEVLFDLIEAKKANECTILGIPTDELWGKIVTGADIMEYFKEKGIEIPFELDPDKFESTFINVYMPHARKDIITITISKKANISGELVQDIIDNFFKEVLDIYQYDIMPNDIESVLNEGKISFDTILKYLCRNNQQKEIAEKVGISQQMLTELKMGRKNMSIETFSSFVKEFPLLFWHEYINSIENND